jgi:hypothetical protein
MRIAEARGEDSPFPARTPMPTCSPHTSDTSERPRPRRAHRRTADDIGVGSGRNAGRNRPIQAGSAVQLVNDRESRVSAFPRQPAPEMCRIIDFGIQMLWTVLGYGSDGELACEEIDAALAILAAHGGSLRAWRRPFLSTTHWTRSSTPSNIFPSIAYSCTRIVARTKYRACGIKWVSRSRSLR